MDHGIGQALGKTAFRQVCAIDSGSEGKGFGYRVFAGPLGYVSVYTELSGRFVEAVLELRGCLSVRVRQESEAVGLVEGVALETV